MNETSCAGAASPTRAPEASPTRLSKEHTRGIAVLLLAALCWSTGGLLIKWIDWPPLAIAGGRALIAVVFLLLAQRLLLRERPLRFAFTATFLFASLAFAACTISFVFATKLTTAANAVLLQYTAPVWVALFGAIFLNERASGADWVAIVATLLGMALFFADGLSLEGMLGNSIAVFAGICFAAMTILMRKQKDGPVLESIILGNLIAGLVGLPFIVTAPPLDPGGWTALVVLGTIQVGLAYVLYSYAIRRVTALEATLIPVVEPILNPVWVMVFLGERPGSIALLGALIVLVVVTWRATRRAGSAGRVINQESSARAADFDLLDTPRALHERRSDSAG